MDQKDKKSTEAKKVLTEKERLELASKLDAELDEYINSLEKKQYTEGWPEDRWQEEMEKHPFFMKSSPQPGEKLSPLMEGLQQLKYSEEDNTPDELAQNYKEDGNFNYKYKKYRLAILSYTEGIKTNCPDQDLMSQLYNNRAAAHFMLKNFRSSLNDSKVAFKLKPNYEKAINRAATCCFQIQDYDQCSDLCDLLLEKTPTDQTVLKLKSETTNARKEYLRNKRRQENLKKQRDEEKKALIKAFKTRHINLELSDGRCTPDWDDLISDVPHYAIHRVHLDEHKKLVWPVEIVYLADNISDFIADFHEDQLMIDRLKEVFDDPADWDKEKRYNLKTTNVYFETKNMLYVVNIRKTLGEILQDKRLVVRKGTPRFIILIGESETESSACLPMFGLNIGKK